MAKKITTSGKATTITKENKFIPPKKNETSNDVKTTKVNQGKGGNENAPAPLYRRNMTGLKEIFTDLFKLCVAKVIKYEGWEKPGKEHPESHPNKYSTWEHTHPFRTYDKKGDRMKTCTPIGGHFHVVEWEDGADPESPPVIKSVSGPMVMGRSLVRGREVQSFVQANDFDFHTHDVEYLRSSKIEFSTTNIEAAKVMAFDAQKTAPIPGVTER